MASSLWIGVSTLWVSTFLYGIYLVLFCRCIAVFKRRQTTRAQAILLASAIVMFLLSTTSVVIFLLQGVTLYGTSGALRWKLEELQVAGALVYVTNNIVGDLLLIYRCYVIWNTIYITIVPLVLLIATMVFGYTIQLKLFFILSLTTNLLIPTLVAIRLWWILRRVQLTAAIGGKAAAAATRKQGWRAMTILLESGLIYSIVVSIHMVFFHYDDPMDQIVYAALAQVVGIVPTLIIVRVGSGVSQDCGGGGCSGGDSATIVGSLHAYGGPPSIMVRMGMDDEGMEVKAPRRWEVDSPV